MVLSENIVSSFLSGSNPLTNQITLLFTQIIIIVSLSRLIGQILKYMNQPQVIAEVIGGIILGKSALSSIPQFKDAIFPESSMPSLTLIANFGLTMYLFLVGLELDPKSMLKTVKQSIVVSISGIVVPFAFGVGTSYVFYYELMEQPSSGVAMSITAFPVLARILTERNLLETRVGHATIAAAAIDDLVAWDLLLVVIAIAKNSGQTLLALYSFLSVIAWALFLFFVVRPIFLRIIKASSVKGNGISETSVFVTFFLVFISSWFTEAVGVHGIFGSFLVGLITPHDDGFAIKISEKIEDLVCIVLLPLYFAISGLYTRIDLLNTPLKWGMVLLAITVACVGKILGCYGASRFSGYSKRESLSIGILMNTKGLVELIVLNIGLGAGIINYEVFTVMVVMALTTTFLTVPLISFVYPKKHYRGVYQNTEQPSNSTPSVKKTVKCLPNPGNKADKSRFLFAIIDNTTVGPFTVLLNRFKRRAKFVIEIVALRLINIDDRLSTLVKLQGEESMEKDSAFSTFQAIADLNMFTVESMLQIVPENSYIDQILDTASNNDISMILLTRPQLFFTTTKSETLNRRQTKKTTIEAVFLRAQCTVGVLIPNTIEKQLDYQESSIRTMRSINSFITKSTPQLRGVIFVPFFGGYDDREALKFAVLSNRGVDVCVLLFKFTPSNSSVNNEDARSKASNVEFNSAVDFSGAELREDLELIEAVENEAHLLSKSSTDGGRITIENVNVCDKEDGISFIKTRVRDLNGVDMLVLGSGVFQMMHGTGFTEKGCGYSVLVVNHPLGGV